LRFGGGEDLAKEGEVGEKTDGEGEKRGGRYYRKGAKTVGLRIRVQQSSKKDK
jgi:hypothetical protein